MSTATYDQQLPTAIPDGAGGALIVWQDRRTDPGDIYAQRILSFGRLDESGLAVPEEEDAGLRLSPPVPNPTHGPGIDVRLSLPDARVASVELLDLQGRRVVTQQVAGAGWHSVRLEAEWPIASGVYFLTLRSGTLTQTRRVTILN